MSLITCPECGVQISDKAEYCPNCGLQINTKSEKQNKSVSYDVDANKVQKKKMLGLTIGIVVACIVTLCIVYVTTRPSNENVPSSSDAVVEENVEENFKKTLGEDVKIVAEISDSKKKRIYYLDNSDGTKLMVHDYKTKHTKTISESGLWWMDWKLAGDRLFYTTNSGACGEAGFVSGVSVFYLDTNDDSEHLVTECSEAEFDGYNRVKITKVSAIDTRADYWGDYKYESREYYLDLFASESEYEKSRQEQQRIEEKYAQQRNQQSSNSYSSNRNNGSFSSGNSSYSARRFYQPADVIDYTNSHTFVDHSGATLKITFSGLYSNGRCLSGAPEVTSINGTRATVVCYVPTGGALRVYVDSGAGTITDAHDGNVYYAR